MKRVAIWAAITGLVVGALVVAAGPVGDGAAPEQRVDHIAAALRCPVCQGLSVKDSDSQTARDIRADIERRVASGDTEDEVRAAYVQRYGEWILLRPASTGFQSLVWAIPSAAIAAGAVFLGVSFVRWRRRIRHRPATDDELVLVAMAMATRTDPAKRP